MTDDSLMNADEDVMRTTRSAKLLLPSTAQPLLAPTAKAVAAFRFAALVPCAGSRRLRASRTRLLALPHAPAGTPARASSYYRCRGEMQRCRKSVVFIPAHPRETL